MTALETQGMLAKKAERQLAVAGMAEKNAALEAVAQALIDRQDEWLAANERDMAAARASGMRESMLDRLKMDKARVEGVADGVLQVAALPDPVGQVVKTVTRPNGLIIQQRRVPIGVIGIIYEARPNVTVDAAALCLKSGNAVILRGGKEAFNSNITAVGIIRDALGKAGLPADCVSLVQDTSHESANELMNLTEYLDVLIPRGSARLIRAVTAQARVPVIRTGEGVCHVYVHKDADLQSAARILSNAKCSRPSVCNAAECAIVDRAVATEFLPIAWDYLKGTNTILHGDEEAAKILGGLVTPATDADWDTEYGDYQLAVKIVGGLDEALEFISLHGTGHSEAIVTENYTVAQRFLNEVDAAAVYVNASTRFTDGAEFGLGAEIGISTQKIHARGPMGLEALTSTKFAVYGSGQIR